MASKWSSLKKNAEAAVQVCGEAAAAHPQIAHYEALLARATFAAGRYDEAVRLYRKAAEANDVRAMVSLGLLLETGDHAPKDLKAAYALYEKAAERGSADGALDLAVALVKGKGIDVDVPRALDLLGKASDDGSARAAYDLAALVSNGVGGKPPGEALALFRRAAAQGYPEGYRAAAVLLDEGRGVAKTRPPPRTTFCARSRRTRAKREPNSPEKRRSGRPKPSGSFRPGSSRLAIMPARSTEGPARRSGQR